MDIFIAGLTLGCFVGTSLIALIVIDKISELKAELKKYNKTIKFSCNYKTKKRSYRRSKQITSKLKIIR